MTDAISEIFHDEGFRGVPGLAPRSKADSGGLTNLFGVTLKTYCGFLGTPLDTLTAAGRAEAEKRLEEMGEGEARLVMKRVFVEPTGIDRIPNEWVKNEVLDMAWHSGPANAIKALQRAIRAVPDGIIGTLTLAGIPVMEDGAKRLARIFLAERMEFIGRWAAGNMTDADKNGIPDRLQNTPGILNRIGKHMRKLA